VKLQKWRNDRGFIKESGVKELCESTYNSQGFEKKEGVETWIGQQMTKIADMHPARPQSQILRLMYVDMAALGLNHSRQLPDLVKMIKTGCENHPETFSAIVILPNTPSYGKGLKADGVRDKNISSAIKDIQLLGTPSLICVELAFVCDGVRDGLARLGSVWLDTACVQILLVLWVVVWLGLARLRASLVVQSVGRVCGCF
jgi:hypothetical protein